MLDNKNLPDLLECSYSDLIPVTRDNLVKQLFNVSPGVILSSQLAALAVFGALYRSNLAQLRIWIITFTIISLSRLALTLFWRYRKVESRNFRHWLLAFTVGAILAGFSWAALIVFGNSHLSLMEQVFVVIMMIGIPIASMPAYALYQPVYCCFVVPILVALMLWSYDQGGGVVLPLACLVLAYSLILWITSRVYHKNAWMSVMSRLKNQQLLAQLSAQNKELADMAYYDPLTGLNNRRGFKEEAKEAQLRCQQKGGRIAVLLLDIDDFKRVNDTLGHSSGDQLLTILAERLTASLRCTDTVSRKINRAARFGGDEFVIFLEDVEDEECVERTAERIMAGLQQPVKIYDVTLNPTLSMGIAISPEHGDNIELLTRNADIAMYSAKRQGKKQFLFYQCGNQVQ